MIFDGRIYIKKNFIMGVYFFNVDLKISFHSHGYEYTMYSYGNGFGITWLFTFAISSVTYISYYLHYISADPTKLISFICWGYLRNSSPLNKRTTDSDKHGVLY
jgi:hypothetical protein